ncbi:MAG: alpha/beta hydrolase [Spirochaetaceae bacterium]|nr:MAG: alpha/beta hydrolase [Spirochaetaceae bacterium]
MRKTQKMNLKSIIMPVVGVSLALAWSGCNLLDPSESGNLVPLTVDEGNPDHAAHAVELNGSVFHVETYGNPLNPTIIILHGGPGGDFRYFLRMKETYSGYSLQHEYYLVFWDQRGSGLSKRHGENNITLDIFLEDLDQMVDTYSSPDPVILIGHSWGAMYATQYINAYPAKVRGAVLSEPGALTREILDDIKDDLVAFQPFTEWLNDMAWEQQFLSPDDHARMDYLILLAKKDSQPLYHMDSHGDDPEPSWRFGAAVSKYLPQSGMDSKGNSTWDFTTNLSSFTGTVLFMASGDNELIGEDHQTMQMDFYPDSQLVVIPNCGHDYWWTNTAEVVDAIHVFLNTL